MKLRWKNLKQTATKDNSKSQQPKTGNKPYKQDKFTDVVLDIIGGERSQALHGIQSVPQGGESGLCETETPSELASESEGLEVFTLDLVEAEPEDLSTQEHDNTPTQDHEEDPRAPTVPPQKKQGLAKSQEDGYVDLVRKETERAEIQIALAKEQTTLAKEQITLTLLHQRETKLHIVLLEERLRNDAIAMSDEDNVI